MVLKASQERVKTLLKDTITLLCKNGLEFTDNFTVEAVIGITLDNSDVFLISMNELVQSTEKLNKQKLLDDASPQSADTTTDRLERKRKRRLSNVKEETGDESTDSFNPAAEDLWGGGEPPSLSPSALGGEDADDSGAKRLRQDSNIGIKLEPQDDGDEESDEDLVFVKQEATNFQSSCSQQLKSPSSMSSASSYNYPQNSYDMNWSQSQQFPSQQQQKQQQQPFQSPQQSQQQPHRQVNYAQKMSRTSTTTSSSEMMGDQTAGPDQQGMAQQQQAPGVASEYICGCGKIFTFYTNLVTHQRLEHHLNEKGHRYKVFKIRCKTCGYVASRLNEIRHHEMSEHGAPAFVCEIDNCLKQYKYRDGLNRHKRQHHPGANLGSLEDCTITEEIRSSPNINWEKA